MGRPQLDLGTAGTVRLYETKTGGWKATTRFRDWDGVVRQVAKTGSTKGAAQRALSVALRDRGRATTASQITADTKIKDVAEVWFEEVKASDRSPSTISAYRDRLDQQVLPALGAVKLRELTVGLIDRHLAAVTANNGPSVAKLVRTVLSGVCGLACRYDAMGSNPVRDVGRISIKIKRPKVTLGPDETIEVLRRISEDDRARRRDIPDLVGLLAGSGLRIGEALALRWSSIDLEGGTLDVSGTVLRLRSGGLTIKPAAKSAAGMRTLELPQWVTQLLRLRRAAWSNELVFPSPVSGQLRDPSNMAKQLRQTFDDAGQPHLTSHSLRRGVATIMDQGGLSARAAADQLGHAKVSLTQDFYMSRKVRSTGAAALLEVLGPSPAG